jgi:hypothetical protein
MHLHNHYPYLELVFEIVKHWQIHIHKKLKNDYIYIHTQCQEISYEKNGMST